MEHARKVEESIQNMHENPDSKIWGRGLDKKKTFNWLLKTREQNSLECAHEHDNEI